LLLLLLLQCTSLTPFNKNAVAVVAAVYVTHLSLVKEAFVVVAAAAVYVPHPVLVMAKLR
jgi:hypothetical protein